MKVLGFYFGGILSICVEASCALYDGDLGLVHVLPVD